MYRSVERPGSTEMDGINRASTEPYYLQLARIIERRIKDGTFEVGARLPSEAELCRIYDLARSTVRETLRLLEQQHLIRLIPRRGAFVHDVADNSWILQVTEGFLESQAHSAEAKIETAVIRSGMEPLGAAAAAALELAEGTPGFALERVRYVNGVPALHSTNWLPAPLGQELIGKPVLEGKASLNATLRAAGFTIASSRREVAAVSAPPDTARRLELTRSAPVLRIRSVSRDVSGRPIDYYESLVRSDILTIAVNAEAASGVRGESR
jgi:GntR family transcriptional regulator